MFRSDLFQGKRFLVSGGGTGLGRIMMERFVELGADCVICGRRGAVLEQTAREVMARHPGRRVDTHIVDIRVAAAVEEMIDPIWATGPLDGLVNNAAGNFISQTKDLNRQHRPAWHVLHDQRLRQAMDRRGTQGECHQHSHNLGADGQSVRRAIGDRYVAHNPMGRVGKPGELANMAAFLMSDEVEYINGEVIAIDGGMGIMGSGTFSNMMAYSDDDWRRIREQIQSTNAADKVKRG